MNQSKALLQKPEVHLRRAGDLYKTLFEISKELKQTIYLSAI